MPERGTAFETGAIRAVVSAEPSFLPEEDENDDAADDMKQMDARQNEIEHVEIVSEHRYSGAQLLGVFNDLQYTERGPTENCKGEEMRYLPQLVRFGGLYREDYKPGTGQEDQRIDPAVVEVERLPGEIEEMDVFASLNHERGKEQAEHHHVGGNENPDALLSRQASWVIQNG
jgi:hypothetical protein